MTAAPRSSLPSPQGAPVAGHLGRWGKEPLTLLEEGAALGEAFELRLWRRAVVGYSTAWNRTVLGDLDTFRSRGSLSGMTPYLNGGVVMTDPPAHAERRAQLNPHFHATALAPLRERLARTVDRELPRGSFDTVAWSLRVVPALLNEAFFGGSFPPALLAHFLAPLHRPLPGPLLPRPVRFARVRRQIARRMGHAPEGALVNELAHLPGAAEEVRVSLAAGFDTTSHTLSWALWFLASHPDARNQEALPRLIKETQRLYPAGWLGSRVTSRPFTFEGRTFPRGLLVFYSPYLTHRHPDLWRNPASFEPDRFASRPPAWGYIPFAAGPRACLGMHLARMMLEVALEPFLAGTLEAVDGDPRPRTGLTLAPRGPLQVRWDPRA
ncbi:MAG: cytochrome P450 [Trueperaceae bacterium]|nr:cytochrome P450 [Trueperaceae bacterium]MDZ7799636.1 cytochrome P450 [Trueperaceae bacterium]